MDNNNVTLSTVTYYETLKSLYSTLRLTPSRSQKDFIKIGNHFSGSIVNAKLEIKKKTYSS